MRVRALVVALPESESMPEIASACDLRFYFPSDAADLQPFGARVATSRRMILRLQGQAG